MRIGVVATTYPREPGDPAGCFVAGLSRWLATQGHELEAVAAAPGRSSDGQVRVHRVRPGAALFYGGEGAPERLERMASAWLRAPVFTAALLASVARRIPRWDAVVSHWLVPSAAVVAALGDRPHIAIAHSGDVHLLARVPGAAAIVTTLLLARRRTRVCFSGEHLRDRFLGALPGGRLRRALADRSFVSPVGLDVAALAAARELDRRAARLALGLPGEGVPVIGFLGRLVPIKGVDVLLAAARRLRSPHVLVVAGDGPERARLTAAAVSAGQDARFPGELRGDLRDRFFAAIDLLVVPSIDLATGRTEGTPAVVLEALAAGIPLIASRVGGIADAVGDAAVLVPPGDPAACAAALERLLADPTAAAALAARAHARARRFDWSQVGARILAALDHGPA